MSNTLAIGAVTATLRQLLDAVSSPLPGDPPSDPDLADAFVSAKALDIARPADEHRNQLNLFLFQVTYDATFRNMDMAGTPGGGSGQQPLALCLYYVLTAWGHGEDDQLAHRVLGRAMSILHDNSLISRTALQAAMPASDLWQQVERVRVRPYPLGVEEISKLWTGFSKPYRISIGYEVSVVLIESTKPAIAGLPVLTRGKPTATGESGPHVQQGLDLPYPVLDSFECEQKRPAVRLGETLTIRGSNLGGTPLVAHFDHRLFAQPQDLPPVGPRDATSFQVKIPTSTTAWPAGMYTVTVDVKSDQLRTTNVLAVPLAPTITTITPLTTTPALLELDIGCTPEVWADQKVSLIIGDRQVGAEPHGQTATVRFRLENPPSGLTYLRLRVDGVDSLLVTDFTQSPPVFDPTKAIALP